ncbi:sulfoquinovose mutarotase [Escherichia coli]|nr:sulfoquinovose mutarotase [Escherichia coli]
MSLIKVPFMLITNLQFNGQTRSLATGVCHAHLVHVLLWFGAFSFPWWGFGVPL